MWPSTAHFLAVDALATYSLRGWRSFRAYRRLRRALRVLALLLFAPRLSIDCFVVCTWGVSTILPCDFSCTNRRVVGLANDVLVWRGRLATVGELLALKIREGDPYRLVATREQDASLPRSPVFTVPNPKSIIARSIKTCSHERSICRSARLKLRYRRRL